MIRIEATRYLHRKSEDSIADLPVDREVMAIFRAWYERAKGPFVIKSSGAPLPPKPRQYYRCDRTFEQVNVWLRKHGVGGSKPLHTLRKEYGSLLIQALLSRSRAQELCPDVPSAIGENIHNNQHTFHVLRQVLRQISVSLGKPVGWAQA